MARQEGEVRPTQNEISRIASLSNRLVSAKEAAPGSAFHKDALRNLMDAVANTPGAINVLARIHAPSEDRI